MIIAKIFNLKCIKGKKIADSKMKNNKMILVRDPSVKIILDHGCKSPMFADVIARS